MALAIHLSETVVFNALNNKQCATLNILLESFEYENVLRILPIVIVCVYKYLSQNMNYANQFGKPKWNGSQYHLLNLEHMKSHSTYSKTGKTFKRIDFHGNSYFIFYSIYAYMEKLYSYSLK